MWEYSPLSEQQWESLSQAELSWAWCVGAAACEHSSTSSSYLNVYYRFLHWITHTTAHSDLQNVNRFVIVLLLTWMVEVMVGTMEVAGEETMLESWEGLMTAGAVNIVRITNWLCFDYCYCLTWQRSELSALSNVKPCFHQCQWSHMQWSRLSLVCDVMTRCAPRGHWGLTEHRVSESETATRRSAAPPHEQQLAPHHSRGHPLPPPTLLLLPFMQDLISSFTVPLSSPFKSLFLNHSTDSYSMFELNIINSIHCSCLSIEIDLHSTLLVAVIGPICF